VKQAARPECCVEGFRVPTLRRDVVEFIRTSAFDRAPVIVHYADTRTLALQQRSLVGERQPPEVGMTDPRTILGQARQGPVPVNWRVFTKKRGKVSGFLRGSSHDPDPLLVITPDGAIEYANERKPLTVVNFIDLAGIALQARGSSFSDSTIVTLDVWIDLHYRDWSCPAFVDTLAMRLVPVVGAVARS